MATRTVRKPALNKKRPTYVILGTSPETGEKFIVPPEDVVIPYTATSAKSVEKAAAERKATYPKYEYRVMQLHELLRSYDIKIDSFK